jgi:hypothetical protein
MQTKTISVSPFSKINGELRQQELFNESHFNGSNYEPDFDDDRLRGQIKDVFRLMKDGIWRTLDEIHFFTGHPHASISAQLRHLRKERFGSHIIDKQPRGERSDGLWEYKLIVNTNLK